MKRNELIKGHFPLIFLLVILFILTGGNSLAQGINIYSDANPEAVEYLQLAVAKMEEAIDTYQGANYPGRQLWT